MKSSILIPLIFLAGCAATGGQDTVRDAVLTDQDYHQVVLENDHVRVIEVFASSGAKVAMHSHPPHVLVSLGRARARFTLPDGSEQVLSITPGMVLWSDANAHAWELLAGHAHVLSIEVKGAVDVNARTGSVPGADDATILDPAHHQVVLENEHVRVFRALVAPGATSPMHSHPMMLLVCLERARFEIEFGDGRRGFFDMLPGMVVWVPGTTHGWKLVAGQGQVIGVEIK